MSADDASRGGVVAAVAPWGPSGPRRRPRWRPEPLLPASSGSPALAWPGARAHAPRGPSDAQPPRHRSMAPLAVMARWREARGATSSRDGVPLGIGAGLELLRTLAEAARITIVLPDEAS